MKLTKLKVLYVDLIAVGVLVALALAAYLFGVRPVIQRHHGLDIREVELNTLRSKEKGLSTRVVRVASEIKKMKHELANNAIQLKSASQINSQLARLGALTGKCGLKLDQLRPDKYLSGSRYQTVPIYLVGSGNFPACVKLLGELKRGFSDTSVASFEINGDPTKPDEPTRLRVDLLWYALADDTTASR
jgi:hypothetical protein